ncbi:MAG: tRNA (adenosine(37)-N6)-threonylcarbamoyltransferase complex ATPase subunit type 1 TsaE [Acidiferrobacterales bacterium]|jgi:tRNA threonylcarbamoyladenosine biosynthesis protein TsaE
MRVKLAVPSVAEMEALGARLARGIDKIHLLYLHGALGTGKTTLVRGILRALGHVGLVKSPTFTLVEPYSFDGLIVYHIDLYRVSDPEELEFLGFRDYLESESVCLVEWAERGVEKLPSPDLDVTIQNVDDTRTVELESYSDRGTELLSGLT